MTLIKVLLILFFILDNDIRGSIVGIVAAVDRFNPPGQMSAGMTCEMMVTFKPMVSSCHLSLSVFLALSLSVSMSVCLSISLPLSV